MNPPAARKIRLLVADDHPLVFEGVKACLKGQRRIEIIGQASDGAEAISKAKLLQPDIILMDISMPGLSGLEATRVLRKEAPQAKILVFTMHSNREYVLEMNRAGANGYVLKDASPQELLRAIFAAYQGGDFSSASSNLILQHLQADRNSLGLALHQPVLSQRERQVLGLIVSGLVNKEIAQRLNLSTRTVETHRLRIMRKLKIHNVAGLTKYALARGIGSDL